MSHSVKLLLIIVIFINNVCNSFETTLIEWCDSGCNVLLDGASAFHCIHSHHQLSNKIVLSNHNKTNNVKSKQCLYHQPSYNLSVYNVTMTQYDVVHGMFRYIKPIHI